MPTLIALDPGGTTGIAIVQVRTRWLNGERDDPSFEGLGRAVMFKWHGQVGNLRRNMDWPSSAATDDAESKEIAQVDELSAILEMRPQAAVLYERFIPRTQVRTLEAFSPMRIAFALQYDEMHHGNGRTFFWQTASAMAAADNDRLKRAGLYAPGLPHATDAARHAAVFLRACRADAKKRALAWPHIYGGDQ